MSSNQIIRTCALQHMDLNSVWLCIGWLTWVVTSVGGHGSKYSLSLKILTFLRPAVPVHQKNRGSSPFFCYYGYSSSNRSDNQNQYLMTLFVLNHLWRSRLLCLQVTRSGCSGVDRAVQVRLMSLPSWTKTSLSPWILA